MTETMIDRVAEAMRLRAIERGRPIHPTMVRHLAVAAIEALLKPTPEMLSAMEPWTRVSGHQDSIWKVGIETALGKSPLRPAGTADEHGVPRAEE